MVVRNCNQPESYIAWLRPQICFELVIEHVLNTLSEQKVLQMHLELGVSQFLAGRIHFGGV